MTKKYTIYDFLQKTKLCLNCNNTTNLSIYQLDSNANVLKTLSFGLGGNDIIIVNVKIKFKENKSSFIRINSKTHHYVKQNVSDDFIIGLERKCIFCYKYKVCSNLIFFKTKVSPVVMKFMQVYMELDNYMYLLQESMHEDKLNVMVFPSEKTFKLNNISILNVDKKWLINKLNRYLIL